MLHNCNLCLLPEFATESANCPYLTVTCLQFNRWCTQPCLSWKQLLVCAHKSVFVKATFSFFFDGHQKLSFAHINNFYNLILVLVHTNCYIILNLIIIEFFFKLININVNPALLLSGNLLFRQNFLTSELFIIPIHVSVRKKYIVIRKRLIRNLVLIRNNFNRIHNFSHIY